MLDSGRRNVAGDLPGRIPPADILDNNSDEAPAQNDVPHNPIQNVNPGNRGTNSAVSATEAGRDVIYHYADNSRIRYTGGTRAWRNTNPGNLRYYDFSKSMGAIGGAGGFAVFPDEDAGMDALVRLLRTDTYRRRTIGDAVRRYAPPSENDTARYMQRLANLTGLDLSRRVGDLNDSEILRVANAIRQIEGWRSGRKMAM